MNYIQLIGPEIHIINFPHLTPYLETGEVCYTLSHQKIDVAVSKMNHIALYQNICGICYYFTNVVNVD